MSMSHPHTFLGLPCINIRPLTFLELLSVNIEYVDGFLCQFYVSRVDFDFFSGLFPSILVGDFNCGLHSSPMNHLTSSYLMNPLNDKPDPTV